MAYPTHMLPQDIGVFFNSHDLSVLEEPLRSRIYTAMQDAPANEPLSITSGRRSPWQQYLLRVGRVGASHAFDSRYPGHPTTALPYHSHHQLGTAVDMGGRGLDWLQLHRHEYGLDLTVSGEDWHFEVVGPPKVPITPYPNGGVHPPPTLPPEDTMAIDEATLFQLVGGAVRPTVRLAYIAGHQDKLYVTNGIDFARPVGARYHAFLYEHFNIGAPIEIKAADAAVLGNIIRTSMLTLGESVPKSFRAESPATW